MIYENILSFSIQSFWCKVAVLFVSYFTPIREIVHVMLIFLFIDTISGIWASLKSGEKLESSKLRKTVYKFLWYTIAVMCSLMMERTFGPSWLRLASIVGGFICSVELTSIFENIARITGDPIFRRLIRIIKKKSAETVQEVSQDENSEIKSGT
jgi:phage-related holin